VAALLTGHRLTRQLDEAVLDGRVGGLQITPECGLEGLEESGLLPARQRPQGVLFAGIVVACRRARRVSLARGLATRLIWVQVVGRGMAVAVRPSAPPAAQFSRQSGLGGKRGREKARLSGKWWRGREEERPGG
jgi:hypothetical protein